MDRFININELPKLDQENIKVLNIPITRKETEAILKILPTATYELENSLFNYIILARRS